MKLAVPALSFASSVAVAGLASVYAVILAIGLSTAVPGSPIGDPWFSILEGLILLIAPAMVAMAAALHFTILCLINQPAFAGSSIADLLAFRWPSLAYAIDILAWDFFFPLALLFAAPAIRGGRVAHLTRWTFVAAAVVSLAGLIGPATGNMGLRNIGILGYAVVFPVAAALNAFRVRR